MKNRLFWMLLYSAALPLVASLGGCFFEHHDRDDRDRHIEHREDHHEEHHDDADHDRR